MEAPPRRLRTIPAAAKAIRANGSSSGFDYLVRGNLVARVYFHDTGAIEWEMHFDQDGRRHGVERYEHESGRRKWSARYVHGLQHGLQRQWDERGDLICATRFVRGTGVDLWFCDHRGSRLAEERHFRDGERDGPERWWSGLREIWREVWYRNGIEHGVEREWNEEGRLRRGFPRYWVGGKRLTRRQYVASCRHDPSLRPIEPKEDRARRTLPSFFD